MPPNGSRIGFGGCRRDRDRVDGEVSASQVFVDRRRGDRRQRSRCRVGLGPGPGDVGMATVAEVDHRRPEAVVALRREPEPLEDRLEVGVDRDVDVRVGIGVRDERPGDPADDPRVEAGEGIADAPEAEPLDVVAEVLADRHVSVACCVRR